MSLAFEIAVIVFLVLLNGAFAMSEMAIVSSRRQRLASRAAEGSRGAALALRLADDPGRFLSCVQIGITLVGILAGTYSGATLAGHLALWLAEFPMLAPVADALSITVVVSLITYASLIVGELVPKRIALSNPERIAALVAPTMMLMATIASPVVWLLEGSTRLALRLLGVSGANAATVTQEEVREMVAEGTEAGVIDPREQEMISGVLRFGDRRARAIMTPRGEVVWIDLEWEPKRIEAIVRESPHSRFPAYRGTLDDVVGVIQAKDLLDGFMSGSGFDPVAAVRPIEVVPDTAPALQVLDVLKRSRIHMALVVDEYGEAEGIVTATDILLSVLGTLAEHGEDYEGRITRREDGSWLLDGDVAVDMAAERTGCRVMSGGESDFTTVAGFVLWRLRAIPEAGDHFIDNGWRFEVIDMDGRRIDKVLLARVGAEEGDPG
ncbi:hemolysin family protein [Magnetospirillum fulvum]|uniref:Putative hemolysin n=1 Tax=Magnetospirillum fulvum TaxID=1082 RepID=A0A1H6H4X3_MAGFU|nr:hemolysin family protein [Magnetospirillum fulvum]SEH30927.1 putative hemolysin [Magnetospirillum fulvum]